MTNALDKAMGEVHAARSKIREEITAVCGEITRLEEENRTLPGQPVSFREFKKCVLDLVTAAGARYAETHIRSTIIDFAKGANRDMANLDKYGQPLTLGELDQAIGGKLFPMANARLLSGGTPNRGEDMMLYAVFSGAVTETLSRVMERMSPEELGLEDDPEGGMTREEMRGRIAANLAEIERLKERKTTLEGELARLS